MLATARTTLPNHVLNLFDDFLHALADGGDLTVQAQDWETLEKKMTDCQHSGWLEPETASIVHHVANNVTIIGKEAMRMQKTVEDLCQELDDLFVSHDSNSATSPELSLTTAFPPIPSPPRSPENSLSTEPSALRQWFVSNIFFPYPTPAEKASLAAEANIPIKKISPNLCNLRRRSGWQAFIQKWCDGNRDEAHKLFRRVASGAEARPQVLKEIEDIKEYATRSLVVRDWVPEVARTSTQLKHATYQSLSAAPTTPAPSTEDINTVERLTPQRSFSNSSTDSADSNTSSATDVSSSIPSTPPQSIVYSSMPSTTSNKRSLNPEAGEFVPSAKRVRIRFEITEPEPIPMPASDWAIPGLSQSLWMGGAAREMSPSPAPAPQPFTSAAVGWEVPGLPAPEPEATFMSIFGLDAPIDIEDITRSATPSFNKQ